MKIGIIIHSKTGNTLSVAQRLLENLLALGHFCKVEKVVATNDEEMDPSKIVLENQPDLTGYDCLILAAPVRAFSLSPVMKAYLARASQLSKEKVFCYVTEGFPFSSMGGNRAIKQFNNIIEAKGAIVEATGIINWSNPRREKQIVQLVNKFISLIN
ncbi:flavodoxin family protein [Jeotgalibaca sp. A122]|uniref:flavodoxin family protein n=1 Tax=Jeotgalibaca sp. A122 TaxID=3457322 RepID=UPI003FCFE4C6